MLHLLSSYPVWGFVFEHVCNLLLSAAVSKLQETLRLNHLRNFMLPVALYSVWWIRV